MIQHFDSVALLVLTVLSLPIVFFIIFSVMAKLARGARLKRQPRRTVTIEGRISVPEGMDGASLAAAVSIAIEDVEGVSDVFVNICEAPECILKTSPRIKPYYPECRSLAATGRFYGKPTAIPLDPSPDLEGPGVSS